MTNAAANTSTGTSSGAAPSWGKARFDEVYTRPDPRGYFGALRPLEYQAPHHGQTVFRRLVDLLFSARAIGHPLSIVDVCSSYGINAALINHGLTLRELYARYTSGEILALGTTELAASDRAFYTSRRRLRPAQIIGLDISEQAIGYARGVGLLHRGFVENLESDEPTDALRAAIADADLVTVTGGSYIFTRTFERLLAGMRRPPWVAVFMSRTIGYEPIAEVLARSGLITQKLGARTFPHRRFVDRDEQDATVASLLETGIDPTGREADGYYHTELYVSRPPADSASLPLERLLPWSTMLPFR